MNYWIIASNSGKFDLVKFLSKHNNMVDWKQSVNVEVGDIVYVYCTKPLMRIKYKMEVVSTDISFSNSIKDLNCWTDKTEFEAGANSNKYFRMKVLCKTDSDMLTMNELHKHGVNGWIQHPRFLSKEVIDYIESEF